MVDMPHYTHHSYPSFAGMPITKSKIARTRTSVLEVIQNDPRVTDDELDLISEELEMRCQEAHEANGGMGGY